MPSWMSQHLPEEYEFNDYTKPEHLARLPPLNEADVSLHCGFLNLNIKFKLYFSVLYLFIAHKK